MQWVESVLLVLFPPFLTGVLYRPVMALFDLFDVWKGWWIPPLVARRLARAVVPSTADIGGYGHELRAPVNSAPATLREHWCQGVRRSWGIEAWLLLFVFLPAALVATMALTGLYLTLHPSGSEDAEFFRRNTLLSFSFCVGMGSGAVLWVYRSLFLYRRRVGESLPLTSAVDLARLLRRCKEAGSGALPLLELDRHVSRHVNRLGWFAAYGVDRERRRTALSPHIAGVQQALEREVSLALRDGPDAVPRLARLVATLLDRSVQGRWMGLLDEADLPETPAELVTARDGKHDRMVVLAGSVAAVLVVATATAVGLPASAVAPAALTAFIGPAVLWGSERLGTLREHHGAVRSGLGTPAPEPTGNAPQPPAPTA
ncbi:hypothetical protein ACFZDG_17360 [Kitasatospora xanthocidica]|uniref:hypothetical protein n=1 Tax=Kitasatospora xanthocidica TaxID=83382 RepID=UPI0036E039C7